MKETIELKVLNELLNTSTKSKYLVQKVQGHIGVPEDGDGNQGEYNEDFRYYKHPKLPEGVFMKETYQTDSYGYGNNLVNIEFVKGKEKTINVRRPNAEFLIEIRKGKHNLQELLDKSTQMLEELNLAYQECDLQDHADRSFFLSLLPKLRKDFVTSTEDKLELTI